MKSEMTANKAPEEASTDIRKHRQRLAKIFAPPFIVSFVMIFVSLHMAWHPFDRTYYLTVFLLNLGLILGTTMYLYKARNIILSVKAPDIEMLFSPIIMACFSQIGFIMAPIRPIENLSPILIASLTLSGLVFVLAIRHLSYYSKKVYRLIASIGVFAVALCCLWGMALGANAVFDFTPAETVFKSKIIKLRRDRSAPIISEVTVENNGDTIKTRIAYKELEKVTNGDVTVYIRKGFLGVKWAEARSE